MLLSLDMSCPTVVTDGSAPLPPAAHLLLFTCSFSPPSCSGAAFSVL